MTLKAITDQLVKELANLVFNPPVAYVYNPLVYARKPYDRYLERFVQPSVEAVLVGMNPGPWGMAQTGIPFGEISAVKQWMGIEEPVDKPGREHPKREIEGFACPRREVSGRRLWEWARSASGTPESFFSRFFVLNYCPLMFVEESGRNRTPDKLPVAERRPLLSICDKALHATLSVLSPRYAVGIGTFAGKRVRAVCDDLPITTGRITHPSPANPRANRGWAECITAEFRQMGIH